MKFEIRSCQFGILQTNCYVINTGKETLVVDPGQGATKWVLENIEQCVVGLINTHGHYDHVFSNRALQEALCAPLIIHQEDGYLLEDDSFHVGLPKSFPDITFQQDQRFYLGEFRFDAIHLPGHTHGTSVYDFGDFIFSGDFVMDGTVGRYNLHTSDREKQYLSLNKYLNVYSANNNASEILVYSGHGKPFTLEASLETVKKWLSFF